MTEDNVKMVANVHSHSKAESAVQDALTVLVSDRDSLPFTTDQLLSICRAVPDYALNLIAKYRTWLMHGDGTCRADIAQLVRTIEWELRGPSEFIQNCYREGTEDTSFLLERLTHQPEEFTRHDLHELLRRCRSQIHPLHIAARDVLKQQVVAFADRIAAQPPGLSHDVCSLKKSIRDYGFSEDLNGALQKIDDELEKGGDAFDQVATMRHIRSFFEQLHKSVAKELQAKKPNVGNGTPLHQCGNAIDYLERKKVITEKIRVLARSLYAILSDGGFGVHALKAERDYTRLCRNMVVEYAVTLFFELERRLAQPGDR